MRHIRPWGARHRIMLRCLGLRTIKPREAGPALLSMAIMAKKSARKPSSKRARKPAKPAEASAGNLPVFLGQVITQSVATAVKHKLMAIRPPDGGPDAVYGEIEAGVDCNDAKVGDLHFELALASVTCPGCDGSRLAILATFFHVDEVDDGAVSSMEGEVLQAFTGPLENVLAAWQDLRTAIPACVKDVPCGYQSLQ